MCQPFAGAQYAAADLKAGFAQVDITPPTGTIITGTDDLLKEWAMVVASGVAKCQIHPKPAQRSLRHSFVIRI